MTPTTVQRIEKSEQMRIKNASKLPEFAQAMYRQGKVKLCRAAAVSKSANNGKGWTVL